MVKTEVSVIVSSVKMAKDAQSKNYVNFLLIGGSLSLAVSNEQFNALKPLEGSEILATFALDCTQIVRYNRPATVFEISKLIDFKAE